LHASLVFSLLTVDTINFVTTLKDDSDFDESDDDNYSDEEGGLGNGEEGGSRIPEYTGYVTPTAILDINEYRQQMALLPCPADVLKNVKLC
jgi:hypothetical protein